MLMRTKTLYRLATGTCSVCLCYGLVVQALNGDLAAEGAFFEFPHRDADLARPGPFDLFVSAPGGAEYRGGQRRRQKDGVFSVHDRFHRTL